MIWSKNIIFREICMNNKIIGILFLNHQTVIMNNFMDQKLFDEEVSVLGNFLEIKTAEETNVILSGDFNSFPFESDTSNNEKK